MTINYKIKGEKLQYDNKRETAKISALSSIKSDKYEYYTGEEIILLSNYIRISQIFKKQTEKQLCDLKSLDLPDKKNELKQTESTFPKNILNDLVSNKLKEIFELQNIIITDYPYYKSKRKTFIILLNILCLLLLIYP